MLSRSTTRFAIASTLIGVLIALVILVSIEFQRKWRENRGHLAGSRLLQLKLCMENYQSIQNRPLLRIRRDESGREIGWREELAPYFDDQVMHAIAENPARSDEFRRISRERTASESLRLPFDQSGPSYTSIVAVYEDDRSLRPDPNREDTRFALVAMVNTAIRWNEPKDLAMSEFLELLAAPGTARHPVALLTAGGQLGTILDTSSSGFFVDLSLGGRALRRFMCEGK